MISQHRLVPHRVFLYLIAKCSSLYVANRALVVFL